MFIRTSNDDYKRPCQWCWCWWRCRVELELLSRSLFVSFCIWFKFFFFFLMRVARSFQLLFSRFAVHPAQCVYVFISCCDTSHSWIHVHREGCARPRYFSSITITTTAADRPASIITFFSLSLSSLTCARLSFLIHSDNAYNSQK